MEGEDLLLPTGDGLGQSDELGHAGIGAVGIEDDQAATSLRQVRGGIHRSKVPLSVNRP